MEILNLRLSHNIGMNCYILIQNNNCIIVDPGFNKEEIRKQIKQRNLTPLAIVLTHMHYDHICALDCFDVDVYVHEFELERIFTTQYQNLLQRINQANIVLDFDLQKIKYKSFKSNEKLKINEFELQTYFTPGHSLGHSIIEVDELNVLSGDCVFFETYGKTTFDFGASLKDQQSSVKFVLNHFSNSVKLWPGHSKPTTIKHELKYNKIFKD